MKQWLGILLGFLTGAAVASVFWGWHSFRRESEWVPALVMNQAGMADFGQQVLSYMDSPDAVKAGRVGFVASNMVAHFPEEVAAWEREFPYMHIKRRMEGSVQKAETFLRHRQERLSTNSPAGVQK